MFLFLKLLISLKELKLLISEEQ